MNDKAIQQCKPQPVYFTATFPTHLQKKKKKKIQD